MAFKRCKLAIRTVICDGKDSQASHDVTEIEIGCHMRRDVSSEA